MYFFEEGPLGLRPMEQTEQDYVQRMLGLRMHGLQIIMAA